MGHLFHVSPDRLECYLGELSLGVLLQSCEEHEVSGRIAVDCDGWPGVIELSQGRAVNASYQNRVGTAAVSLMKELHSGELELCWSEQSGPGVADLGDLGDLVELSIAAVMRHAEDTELGACVTVGNGQWVAELHYTLGSLTKIVGPENEPIKDVAELIARLRAAGRPLVIGLDAEPMSWEGPTHVRAKDDGRGAPHDSDEDDGGAIPHPVLDDMPTQPWQRPDNTAVRAAWSAITPGVPWWRQPFAVPSAIAVTAALSCLLLGILL